MKLGVVDVGGGVRGIYAAGVFDYCLHHDIHFDVGIGVSAGAANIASYLAGQAGRNYVFYTQYALRKEYMSLGNFRRTGSYVDLDYVYGTLSNSGGEYPLDYPALAQNPAEYLIVASDARTGKVKYFTKDDLRQDCYDPCKGSCAIPALCRPYPVFGRPYYDGALSDPVPIEKAFAMGCDKVALILTRPRNFIRKPGKDALFARRIQKQYPLAARNLRLRAQRYNKSVFLAKKYEHEGRAVIIAPRDTCGLDTLTKDREALRRFYEMGLADAAAALPDFLGR